MEADWEVEIGGSAPVIDACWTGFVDLQRSPQLARTLPEAAALPALADSLTRLNAPDSSVWTSKCDLWPHLEPDTFDPFELDAPPDHSAHAMGCYIDLLLRKPQLWAATEVALVVCRHACKSLRTYPLPCSGVDLILRRVLLVPDLMGLGITAYVTPSAAAPTLADALALFAGAFHADSTLQ